VNYRIDVFLTNNQVVDVAKTTIKNITGLISAPLAFTSTAMGGYGTATVELSAHDVEAWNWLNTYLGCRIVFSSPYASNQDLIVWEGLVHTVTINDGKNVTSRSLANLYNRVRVTYSTITYDPVTNVPIFGTQITTADANDTTSQALYGIRVLNYVIGGSNATDAAYLRDTLLAQYKQPLAMEQDARRGGGGDPSSVHVTVECVGIWETLDKLFYTQTASTGNANIDVMVKACLTSVAQFASSDQSNVAINTQQKSQYSQGNVTAQVYLNGLCGLGGPNNLRYFLQFLDNGEPYYFEQPTTPAYRARRLDPAEAIYDAATNLVVPPWMVLPGQLISFDDLIPDAIVYSSALANARQILIGETRYTAPGLLEIVPLVANPADITLARMGLSAIG
jgi:hypothetical protein